MAVKTCDIIQGTTRPLEVVTGTEKFVAPQSVVFLPATGAQGVWGKWGGGGREKRGDRKTPGGIESTGSDGG